MKLCGFVGKIWTPVFASIDLKDAIIRIKDGGSNSIEVKIGEGNFTWTEARNIEYTLDRGRLDDVRKGDEIPVDVSFDFLWEYLKGPSSASTASGGTPTIEDALKNRGAAANWVSTDADGCRPYAVDLEIEYKPTPAACGDKEVIVINDFRWESLDHDLRGASVAVSGKANVTEAQITRSAQS